MLRRKIVYWIIALTLVSGAVFTLESALQSLGQPITWGIFDADFELGAQNAEAALLVNQEAAPLDSAGSNSPLQANATITVNVNGTPTSVNACLLGTNAPAWLSSGPFNNSTFQARTANSGLTLLRLPGGSWSNWYPWLACEQDTAECDSWIGDPSDFINFMQATNLPAMWTVNQNRTSKEAAALVAFFNGSVTDTRVIGTDVKGVNWGTVAQWAQLRVQNGNPDPVGLKFWEIGNEIYGGTAGSGKDCQSFGWEPTWTCDGTEYINGIGSGANRHEGFIEFRDAMRFVDPSILVGAVGVSDPAGWSNWGNEVISAAGQAMDFYIVHEYPYSAGTSNLAEILAKPEAVWGTMKTNLTAAFNQYANGRQIPIAITEHNLFAFQSADTNDLMSKAVNGLFIADSLGQMMKNGFAIANQWDLAHGDSTAPAPSYGMMQAETFFRTPQYYVFPLWKRFGTTMLPTTSSLSAATTLSVYGGRINATTLSVLAINKTGNSITADISFTGVSTVSSGLVDVVKATSLTATSVTFNNVTNPSNDLSNAPSTPLADLSLPITYTFSPYSITLIRITVPAGSFASLDNPSGMEVSLPVQNSDMELAPPRPTKTPPPSPTPTGGATPTPTPTLTPPPPGNLSCLP